MIECLPGRDWISAAAAATFAVLCSAVASAHPVSDQRLHDLMHRIDDAPGDAGLLVRRAELYRERGDRAAALADLRHASSLAPGRIDVALAEGRLWLDAGWPARALDVLDRAVAGSPDDVGARTVRARALADVGRPLAAAADLTRALAQCGPTRLPQPELYFERARLLASAGNAHLQEALDGLEEGLALLGPVAVLESKADEIRRKLDRASRAADER